GMRDQVIAELGVPPAKVSAFYNAVAMPARLAREAPPDGVCHIVMLGRLGKRKGLPQLLDALSSETMRARPWRATLAGDGEVEATRAALRRTRMDSRVVCTGWLDADAVARLLHKADILVLPSLAEGLPIAILEALAHRVAVVATPVGSTPELLRDGDSAVFVPPGDAAALAAGLSSLIDDPAKRARIAAAGHAVFSARLDAAVSATALQAMYREILAPATVHQHPDAQLRPAGQPQPQPQ
ncbi:MAG: glycosyltransferase family 4 protein, partial [Proteobacteria bacterium]|nr:glycosyltransferase family 4 protein [Pseudomonadota bacterium]